MGCDPMCAQVRGQVRHVAPGPQTWCAWPSRRAGAQRGPSVCEGRAIVLRFGEVWRSPFQVFLPENVDLDEPPRLRVSKLPEGPAVGPWICLACRRPDHRFPGHPASSGQRIINLAADTHSSVALNDGLQMDAFVLSLQLQRCLAKSRLDQVRQFRLKGHGRFVLSGVAPSASGHQLGVCGGQAQGKRSKGPRENRSELGWPFSARPGFHLV